MQFNKVSINTKSIKHNKPPGAFQGEMSKHVCVFNQKAYEFCIWAVAVSEMQTKIMFVCSKQELEQAKVLGLVEQFLYTVGNFKSRWKCLYLKNAEIQEKIQIKRIHFEFPAFFSEKS